MAPLRVAAVVALAACSSDPAPILIDAGPIDRCLIPAAYPDLGAPPGAADLTGPNSLTLTLAAGPPKDDLFVSFTDGKGAFAAGLAPGTYAITGADASFNTCGLCTTILAHIDAQAGPAKFFFADAGTITITTIAPTTQATASKLVGAAKDLHFVEIAIGPGGAAPIEGGCTAAIAAVTFGEPPR